MQLFEQPLRFAPLAAVRGWLKSLFQNIDRLAEWMEYTQRRASCKDMGLSPFLERVQGQFPQVRLRDLFLKRFYQLWLDAVYRSDPNLRMFSAEEHERRIAAFSDLDRRQLELARKRVRTLLLQRAREMLRNPQLSQCRQILRTEFGKVRRHRPIRRLMQEAGKLVQALKPCFLMSPLSISQFLGPEHVEFDLVIFDEASQIRPYDAVGAIFRGKQVVVVGDEKQLPPTPFFMYQVEVEEIEDEAWESDTVVEEMESILGECIAKFQKEYWLQWHYRSRHESLIAFSNEKFYNKTLITFPSLHNDTPGFGIEFVHVQDGVYDRGGTRKNVREAQKVTELVMEHFQRWPTRSLGVVAFGEAQAEAILDELDFRRRWHPELEPLFDESREEPFFVKSLENVQGDERDTIIISVGYGRDASGRLTMNFGPLNPAGGERRLNVLVTRAKFHVIVVSSILPHDIDCSRTNSEGVRLLRDYLLYAKGELRPDTVRLDTKPQFDSPFEEQVYKALQMHGLTLHSQVGVGPYRIDLAVVDPRNLNRYCLGIECDGATYHRWWTARERDRLREQVLQGMGWVIHRVWSQDWVKNRNREIEKILRKLEELGCSHQ